ncbi:hypothetical protein [Massilia sp. HP4]|uniref:hypothetical protein n=1 Tax=Massilia sp. HP4 TaxID=2562316 RepID=UPI0010BFDD42|nr:hypothetical protein [Massilia sp. HP4]
MAIDLLNPLDRTSPTFRGDVDALFSGGLNNVIAQMNAELQGVHAMQAGGAYAFMYTFDSSTAVADPGLGRLRMNSATQSAATILRADQQEAGGVNIAALFDAIGAGGSVLKGALRIVKASDPTQWMLFDVLAVGSASGYRNLTVVHRGGTSASPFANGESVMIFVDRAGDVGNGAEVLLGTADITEPTALINFLNIFSPLYDNYRIELLGMTFTATAAAFRLLFAVGGVVTTQSVYYNASTSGATATQTSWIFPQSTVTQRPTTLTLEISNINSAATPSTLRTTGVHQYSNSGNVTVLPVFDAGLCVGEFVASGFQLQRTTGNFTGGKIRVYGRRN